MYTRHLHQSSKNRLLEVTKLKKSISNRTGPADPAPKIWNTAHNKNKLLDQHQYFKLRPHGAARLDMQPRSPIIRARLKMSRIRNNAFERAKIPCWGGFRRWRWLHLPSHAGSSRCRSSAWPCSTGQPCRPRKYFTLEDSASCKKISYNTKDIKARICKKKLYQIFI